MEIDKALSQISEIHAHVARAEVYRDVKALPVAISGGLALVAAALQTAVIGVTPAASYIYYWISVGTVCALISGGGIVRDYWTRPDPLAHLRTRIVSGQFTPCLAAGGLVTVAALFELQLIPHLPGLWALMFSLGIFAARPYLPRMIGYCALYYLAAGGMLLALAPGANSLSPWGMGLSFGVGQILSGLILYWNLERKERADRA